MSGDVRAWLDQLDQAHAAATPGPWRLREDSWDRSRGEAAVETADRLVTTSIRHVNAAAIVLEHNLTPALVAAVRAVADLADQCGEYVHDHGIGDGHDGCPACWVEDIRAVLAPLTAEDQA